MVLDWGEHKKSEHKDLTMPRGETAGKGTSIMGKEETA